MKVKHAWNEKERVPSAPPQSAYRQAPVTTLTRSRDERWSQEDRNWTHEDVYLEQQLNQAKLTGEASEALDLLAGRTGRSFAKDLLTASPASPEARASALEAERARSSLIMHEEEYEDEGRGLARGGDLGGYRGGRITMDSDDIELER